MGGYIGARSGTLSTTVANVQDVTATDTTPEVTIINNTHEDTDGGREGKVIFKGQQSGGEESTLAEIQGSHDGTADDEKGDLIFKTNDGSDGASPTERMRIDSAGNVTVSNAIVLDNKDTTLSGGEVLGKIEFQDNDGGSAAAGITSKIESLAVGDFGASALTLSTSGSSGGARTALTERMRIDNSGKIGIGVNDPDATLDISGGSNKLGILRITQRASGAAAYGLDVGLDPTFGDAVFSRIVNDTVTEAFRIVRATGQVLIGTTTWVDSGTKSGLSVKGGGGGPYVLLVRNDDTGGGANLVKFSDGSDDILGTIVGNATSNTTTYGTSSDYRLKENVTDVSNAITTVKTLKPKTYNFISDPDNTPEDGFLAHELAAIVPNAVTGEKDAMTEAVLYVEGDEMPDGKKVGDVKIASKINPQQVDYGKLTPILTAALQEAIAKIETLETKVTALEAE